MTVLVIEDPRLFARFQSCAEQDQGPAPRPAREIRFYPGLAELRPEARQLIERHIRYLRENPQLQLTLITEANKALPPTGKPLADERMGVIRRLLLAAGLERSRLKDGGRRNHTRKTGETDCLELVYLPQAF